jgi:hypothetical protein
MRRLSVRHAAARQVQIEERVSMGLDSKQDFTIRPARSGDVATILRFVKALAEFERLTWSNDKMIWCASFEGAAQ